MGREASCACWVGELKANVKVLLEPGELLLRGGIRRKFSLAAIAGLRVEGEELCFEAAGDLVRLALGAASSQKWMKAMLKPAPGLAVKLGITTNTVAEMIGPLDDAALVTALESAAKSEQQSGPDLILIRADSLDELTLALNQRARQLQAGVPVWVVYRKGTAQPLGETAVRTLLRARGLIDVKIASVSATLTALKFIQQKR